MYIQQNRAPLKSGIMMTDQLHHPDRAEDREAIYRTMYVCRKNERTVWKNSHRISEDYLRTLVVAQLRTTIQMLVDQEALVQRIADFDRGKDPVLSAQKKLAAVCGQEKDLELRAAKAYEDFSDGILEGEDYQNIRNTISQKLVVVRERHEELNGELTEVRKMVGLYQSLLDDGVGRVLVSTVLFDDESEVLHDRVPLEEVKPLTEKEYYVGGCTALLDAVGFAIKHIANVHKYARDEDRPSKTMFVITTDGMENASREFSYNKLKKLIEKQKEQYHWEFLFLGANIDAADTAEKFGIDRKRARNFHNDAKGIATNYASIGRAVTDFCCMKASAKLDDNWAAEIEADYSSRS